MRRNAEADLPGREARTVRVKQDQTLRGQIGSMMVRSGPVFGDHYHARLLRSPTELVRAIAYVLGNAAHHFGARGVDDYCSAALPPSAGELAPPRGWLLTVGWRRAAPG